MIIIDEERASDSPFVERIWRSHSEGVHPFLSIAVNHCEFVVSRLQGKVTMTLRGPETKATPIGNAPAEGEWVGILLKLGTFLPHLPTSRLVDGSVDLPTASSNSFWLGGTVWQFPDYDNVETFIDRLARANVLRADPGVLPEPGAQAQLTQSTDNRRQCRHRDRRPDSGGRHAPEHRDDRERDSAAHDCSCQAHEDLHDLPLRQKILATPWCRTPVGAVKQFIPGGCDRI